MKKLLVAILLTAATALQAQQLKIKQNSKLSSSISVMGQSMDIPVDTDGFFTVDIKSNDGKKATVVYTLTRLKTATSVMGQEIKIDTDDKTTFEGNPGASQITDALNKPTEAVLENGNVNGKAPKVSTGSNPSESVFIAALLMPSTAVGKKVGDKWTTESIEADGSKTISIFSISKMDANEIEITSNATVAINGKQSTPMGEANQKLSGSITTITLYNATTSLMKGQATQMNLQGTVEAMGQEIPVTLKGTVTTAVN
jgi:hypothetical protein